MISGPQTIHQSRESARFANVRRSADPRDRPLEPQSKTGVHERPVLPEVEIPPIRIERQAFLLDPVKQLVVVILALRSANDLAVPFGREAVVAEDRSRVGRVLLHVEGL